MSSTSQLTMEQYENTEDLIIFTDLLNTISKHITFLSEHHDSVTIHLIDLIKGLENIK